MFSGLKLETLLNLQRFLKNKIQRNGRYFLSFNAGRVFNEKMAIVYCTLIIFTGYSVKTDSKA